MQPPDEISTTEARQGSPRKTNLRVLIVSMLLIVVAAGLIYANYGILLGG